MRVAAAQPSPDEAQVDEIAGRELVVAALAVQGERLDRPAPDARDRQQAPPAALLVAGEQVQAAGGDLARRAQQRSGASGGEIEGLQPGGRDARQRRGGRQVAQTAVGAPPSEAGDDPPLDGGGTLGLDQLSADREGERLEGIGAPPDAQPRAAPNRRSDERIAGEAGMEVRQVVVDALTAKRIRASPCSAASRVGARATKLTRPRDCAVCTTTGSSPWCSSRTRAPARRRIRPSSARPGSAKGPTGVTSTRTVMPRPARGPDAPVAGPTSVSTTEQVHVDEQRARPDDLHELADRPRARAPAGAMAGGQRAAVAAALDEADNGDSSTKPPAATATVCSDRVPTVRSSCPPARATPRDRPRPRRRRATTSRRPPRRRRAGPALRRARPPLRGRRVGAPVAHAAKCKARGRPARRPLGGAIDVAAQSAFS